MFLENYEGSPSQLAALEYLENWLKDWNIQALYTLTAVFRGIKDAEKIKCYKETMRLSDAALYFNPELDHHDQALDFLENFLRERYQPVMKRFFELWDEVPEPEVVSKLHPKVQKMIVQKPYFACYWKYGKKDSRGMKVYELELRDTDGSILERVEVKSGSPRSNSKLSFPYPTKDYAGSGNALPEGIYDIGDVINLGSWVEPGVGTLKIPIEYCSSMRGVNNRGEFLFHTDQNESRYPGSMGCLVTYKSQGNPDTNNSGKDDMLDIVDWHRKYNLAGCALFMDHNLGYLKNKFGLTLKDFAPD